jgi:hypothetical protein
MPDAWYNEGKGGCVVEAAGGDRVLIRAYGGPRRVKAGEELHFDFGLLVTPVKPLNAKAHWAQRYYHSGVPDPKVVAEAGECTIDVLAYQHKRDLLLDALTRIGYEVTKPDGTFYLFPKSPIPDDIAFIRMLLDEGVLAVPGSGFGRSGYFRLSLTVPLDTVQRSISGFERAFKAARSRDLS